MLSGSVPSLMHPIAETFHQTSYLTHWIFIYLFIFLNIYLQYFRLDFLEYFYLCWIPLSYNSSPSSFHSVTCVFEHMKSLILSSSSGISSNSLSFDVMVRLIIFGGVHVVLYFNVYACVHVVFVGYYIEILYIWYCFIASFILLRYYIVKVFAVLKWDLDVVEMSV